MKKVTVVQVFCVGFFFWFCLFSLQIITLNPLLDATGLLLLLTNLVLYYDTSTLLVMISIVADVCVGWRHDACGASLAQTATPVRSESVTAHVTHPYSPQKHVFWL